MQGEVPAPCAGSAAHPYSITHTNGDHHMQHHNPTILDTTRHSSRQGRLYAWVYTWTLTLPYPHLVRSLVRNNGPLTRRIPFRTAPPPILEFVPNMSMHQ